MKEHLDYQIGNSPISLLLYSFKVLYCPLFQGHLTQLREYQGRCPHQLQFIDAQEQEYHGHFTGNAKTKKLFYICDIRAPENMSLI